MVLSLLDQLLIFSHLYLIELLGFLTGLGLLDLWYLIYPRLLTGFGMLFFFTDLSLMEFQVRYLPLFLLFLVIDHFKWFWIESHAGVHQGSILGPALFLLYINGLPDNVICDVAVNADDATLYSKCDGASDLWQQLESDLWDTVDWGKNWLINFNAGRTQLVSFDRSNNNGLLMWKLMGLLRKNHLLRCYAGVDLLF